MKLYLSWSELQMTYVIRESSSVHIIYEGTQQKIFEIGGKVLHELYPVDNLIGYVRDVEKAYKKSRNKNLADILREVDASCAECMFVGEVDNTAKLHYNKKFQEELKIESHDNKIKNLTTPLQISKTTNGKTKIFYPAETEIHILPSNYKNFFGNFSRKANERNTKIYDLMKRYVDLFGNAECITRFLMLLDGEFYHHKIPSFNKFEKICDKLLAASEIWNEKYPYKSNSFFYGKKEGDLVMGAVPPYLDAMSELEDTFCPDDSESLRPQLRKMYWRTYTDDVQ